MTWNRWPRGPGSRRSAGTGTVARSMPRSLPTEGSWATIVMAKARRGLLLVRPAIRSCSLIPRHLPRAHCLLYRPYLSELPDKLTELALRRQQPGQSEIGQEHMQVAGCQHVGMPEETGRGIWP